MGHWGAGYFENDSALDWVDDLKEEMVRRIKSEIKPRRDIENHEEKIIAAAALLDELTGEHLEGIHPMEERAEKPPVAEVLNLNYLAITQKLFSKAETAVFEVRHSLWMTGWGRAGSANRREIEEKLDALIASLRKKRKMKLG